MAESTLRAYLTEIDDLIEHGQLDEAIAHCRHILQTYPKHLDTYRLLGKGYLEAKRYGDAADIFQRVLSAMPDDFVSHVGMSIVREDEGNTDAAIWHMERAFETNPANAAIQQELRRLIGRRDGIEPHKVRLTRGALARMYAHGELYPQAVAELRAALQEDPDRADLQVVLAEMYWRTGQRAEAVEVCSRISDKLPFCREASRILAAAYQASGRTDEAAPYHKRLASLDPYFAFVESAMSDPQTIDASSIRIERLIWQPGQALPAGQPDWASTLGVDLRPEPQRAPAEPATPVSGPIPSWLQDLEGERPVPPATAAPPPAEVQPVAETPPVAPPAPIEPEGEIPDWMRAAGWQESRGEVVEGPVSFSDEEISALDQGVVPSQPLPEGELAPGQIPDWLRAVAPKEVTEARAAAAAPGPLGEPELPGAEGEAGLPAWLQDVSAEAGTVPPEDTANVLGGWEPTPFEPEMPTEPSEAEAELSEAMSADTTPFREGKGVPTWLEESAPGATDTIITWLGDRPGRGGVREELPEWMHEPPPAPEPTGPETTLPAAAEPAEEAAPAEPAQALPAWLSGVAEAAAQQETVLPEEMPWLQEPAAGEEAPREGEEWLQGLGEPEAAAPPAAQREPPDWLRGIVEPGLGKPREPSAPKEAPDWLREATEPMAGRKLAAEVPEPEWLRGIAEPEAKPSPEPVKGTPPAWLQALKEGMPSAPQAEREDADWLRGIAEPEAAEVAEPAEEMEAREWLRSVGEAEAAPAPIEAEAEAPDWLSGLEAGAPAAAEAVLPGELPEPAAPEPEISSALDWLQQQAGEVSPEAAEAPAMAGVGAVPEAELPPAEGVAEDDVLQWLESLAARQEVSEARPAEVLEGAPAEYAPPTAEAPIIAERALPEKPAESLEWLERLAAQRGVEPAERRGGPAAGVPPPETPEWLRAPVPTPPTREREIPPSRAAAPPTMPAPPTPPVEEAPAAAPAWPEEIPAAPTLAAAPPVSEAPAWPPPTRPVEPVREEALPPAEAEVPELPAFEGAEAVEPTPPTAPEPPVWLKPPAEEAPVTGPLEAPEWLRAAAEAEALAPTAPLGPPPGAEPPVEEPPAAERAPTGALEVPEWLRVAAAEPPVSEIPAPEPVSPPAEEPIGTGALEVPEWLSAAAEAEPPEIPEGVPTPEKPMPPLPPWPAAKEPAWLTPGEETLRSLEAELESSLPEWLRAPAEPPLEARPLPPQAAAAPTPPPQPPVTPPPPTPALAEFPVERPIAREAPAEPAAAPMAPAQPRARPAAPRIKPAAPAMAEVLESARRALASGELDMAMKQYGSLIKKKRDIPMVIEDLRAALARDSTLTAAWQTLGDAYMKVDKLPEAIEAYRRGLEAI